MYIQDGMRDLDQVRDETRKQLYTENNCILAVLLSYLRFIFPSYSSLLLGKIGEHFFVLKVEVLMGCYLPI